jgi:hypothetical protein
VLIVDRRDALAEVPLIRSHAPQCAKAASIDAAIEWTVVTARSIECPRKESNLEPSD